MTLDRGVGDRIALLRFVMIFGIIVLHTPEYVPMAQVGDGAFEITKAFFQLAVFRATVPVLTVISGYLLFLSQLDRTPARLFRRKCQVLVVPFLCFNLPLLPLALAAQLGAGITMSVQLWPFDLMRWLDAAFGLNNSPLNYPLNFVRDLIVLMALAPLFGWFLRNRPWIGLALVCLVFFPNLDGALILRDVMPILFYLGGLAAVRGWDPRRLDLYAFPLLLLFVGLCAAMVEFRIANTTYLRLVAPVLIWPCTSWLLKTSLAAWLVKMSKYSYFMFLAHAPLVLASWLLYQRLGQGIDYVWYWLLTPWVVTAVLIAVYRIGMAVAPRLMSFVLGLRGPSRKEAARKAGVQAPAARL